MKAYMSCLMYDDELVEARPLTAEEKTHYLPECADSMLLGTGNRVKLPYVSTVDIPISWWRERKNWAFPGCGNQTIEITDAEWGALVALNAQRQAEKEEQDRQERIDYCKRIISAAERQKDIPTPAEAARRRKAWIEVQNEGAGGYVPQIIDTDLYESAKAQLAELEKK